MLDWFIYFWTQRARNEYLLHAEGEKRELFFRRNKIFFMAKLNENSVTQRAKRV